MRGGAISFIIFFFSITFANAQFSTYEVGDTLFRYSTDLERPLDKFSAIKIYDHLYPCVDEFVVQSSSLPRTEFELITNSPYKEYYSEEGGVLQAIGYNGYDPFLAQPDKFVQFFNDVPVARANRKDDFSSSASTQFFLNYELRDMPQELRDWAEREEVSGIKILGEMQWDVSYNKAEELQVYEVIQGFSTKNKQVFKVLEMELKKDKWTKVTWQGIEVLRESFNNRTIEFLSFYPYQTNVEMARLYTSTPYAMYLQTNEQIGNYTSCRHQQNDIYVYPNPTFGRLNVKFSGAEEKRYVFEVFNIVGKPVWSTNLFLDSSDQVVDVQLQGIEKGIYFYSVSNSRGKHLQTKRLIVIDP